MKAKRYISGSVIFSFLFAYCLFYCPVLNAVPYQQSPDTFYYNDPYYLTNSNEYGNPNQAPWLRNEWDNPPVVNYSPAGMTVNLINQ